MSILQYRIRKALHKSVSLKNICLMKESLYPINFLILYYHKIIKEIQHIRISFICLLFLILPIKIYIFRCCQTINNFKKLLSLPVPTQLVFIASYGPSRLFFCFPVCLSFFLSVYLYTGCLFFCLSLYLYTGCISVYLFVLLSVLSICLVFCFVCLFICLVVSVLLSARLSAFLSIYLYAWFSVFSPVYSFLKYWSMSFVNI